MFRPPTDPFVYWDDLWNNSPESRLFGRVESGNRGRNVYKLLDGTYTETQPAYLDEVAITYYGGHDNVLTAAEEADLIEAGYGDYIEAS